MPGFSAQGTAVSDAEHHGGKTAAPPLGSAAGPQFAILDPTVTDEEVTATSVCVKVLV